jgi:hypothetical protein
MCAIVRRSGGERIHHVDGGDVDNDPLRAKPADPLHQVEPKAFCIGVGERGLHRSDENRPLFQDWYWHEVFAAVVVVFTRSARRCG